MSKELKTLLEPNNRIERQIQEIQETMEQGLTPWLTKDQAARYIGMERSTLDRYMDKIPHSKATGRPKFHRDDLDRFLKEQMVEVY